MWPDTAPAGCFSPPPAAGVRVTVAGPAPCGPEPPGPEFGFGLWLVTARGLARVVSGPSRATAAGNDSGRQIRVSGAIELECSLLRSIYTAGRGKGITKLSSRYGLDVRRVSARVSREKSFRVVNCFGAGPAACRYEL
jgi:hypothetical protein